MRVLFLTHRLPYAPNRGDRARAYHLLKLIAPRFEVQLLSLVHDDHEASHLPTVRQMGVEASVFRVPAWANRLKALPQLLGRRPLTHLLLDAPGLHQAIVETCRTHPPDVVLAYCSGMARFAMEAPLDQIPLVHDMVDVDSAKWAALAATARWPMSTIYQREARTLADFERLVTRTARQTCVVTDREEEILRRMGSTGSVTTLGVGVDAVTLRPQAPPAPSAQVVFCGVMNYAPNVQGVLWFAEHVWPRIRRDRPDARFVIVGAQPSPEILRLPARDASIAVTGTVPDVRPFLWESAVSVAPLLTARGSQNKVLEAIACGLPAVITTPVSAGLPAQALAACRTTDSPEQFAAHVVAVLSLSPNQRRDAAAQANLHTLSWEQQLGPMVEILRSSVRG